MFVGQVQYRGDIAWVDVSTATTLWEATRAAAEVYHGHADGRSPKAVRVVPVELAEPDADGGMRSVDRRT